MNLPEILLDRWMAASGCRWERLRYPRPEAYGETAALRMWPSEAAVGRVVVAHGAGNDAAYPLVGLFKVLLARHFEVFAFDLDGHGRTSTTRFDPSTATGSVPAAVAYASDLLPALPLHLVGHSLGGALVLEALTRAAAEPVRSAVVLSAPLEVRVTARVALTELRSFLSRGALRQCAHYGIWGAIPAFGPFKRRAFPFRHGGSGSVAYVGAVQRLLAHLRLEETVHAVRVPTLLVYGARDRLVPFSQGERLAAALPEAELRRVPGSHFTTPFGAEAEIAAWLERANGAGAEAAPVAR